MEEPLDILCLNCQEMISYINISAHSFQCVYPSTTAISVENSEPLQHIQYRLEKLRDALEDVVFQRVLGKDLAFKYLLNKANELIGITEVSTESVEAANSIMAAIKKFSRTMIKPGLIIYSERLRELANDKTLILIESLASNGFSKDIVNLLHKKYSEIIRIQSDASSEGNNSHRKFLRELSDNLQNIDEIASQISRVMTQRSSTTSLISPDGDEIGENNIGDIDDMYKIKEEEQSIKTIEDLNKYFYSKCLMIKLSYSSRHPSQYIQIHELYKKAKELDVPMEKWEEFIKNEFNQPEKWVNPQVILREYTK